MRGTRISRTSGRWRIRAGSPRDRMGGTRISRWVACGLWGGCLCVGTRRSLFRRRGPGGLCALRVHRALFVSGPALSVSGPGALRVGPRYFRCWVFMCRGSVSGLVLFVSGPGAFVSDPGVLPVGPSPLCVGTRRSLCRVPVLCVGARLSVSSLPGALCVGPRRSLSPTHRAEGPDTESAGPQAQTVGPRHRRGRSMRTSMRSAPANLCDHRGIHAGVLFALASGMRRTCVASVQGCHQSVRA